MRCEACQSENPTTAKFCSECGARLPRTCPSCQFPNAATAKFCNECGTALADAGAAAASNITPSGTQQATSPITPATAAPPIEGERRTVTVLFADMAGFTAMSERMDPEIVTEIINDCLGRAVAVIDQHGGSVNKLTGDGLLALFGAPNAHEDDPPRALRASLEVQRELEILSGELEKRRDVHPRLRIGVNTGLVVAGIVGGAERSEYTVMGDVVNVAARLMAAAEPGGILVGESTQRLTQGLFEFRSLPPVEVKGKSGPLVVFELTSELSEPSGRRTDWHAPLIGRDEELAQLQACFQRSIRSRPQVVSVIGEAGLGKTRLSTEFLREIAEQVPPLDHAAASPTIWHFTCRQEHRQSHELTCQLLRATLGLAPDAHSELVRSRLESVAADLNTDIARLEPLVQLISANPAGAARWDRLYVAPEQGKQRLFLLVQQLIALQTARAPLRHCHRRRELDGRRVSGDASLPGGAY